MILFWLMDKVTAIIAIYACIFLGLSYLVRPDSLWWLLLLWATLILLATAIVRLIVERMGRY